MGCDRPTAIFGAAMVTSEPDATEILRDLTTGSRRAADELMPLVYDELRSLAADRLRRERPGHALQPTALVHEAYLKLIDQTRVNWKGRTHFKAVAARLMGRILVDHARSRDRKKRSGQWRRVALDDAYVLSGTGELDALDLREALEKLRGVDERLGRIVECRVFGGLTNEEVAEAVGVSTRTVEREWTVGLAWLRRELSPGESES